MKPGRRLELAHFAVAILAFAAGCLTALLLGLARMGTPSVLSTPRVFYLAVTAHGVLMGLIFTTFFIMGLGYLFARECLGGLVWERWAWAGFAVALAGSVLVTTAILSGSSTVLYTFYPPLAAHWSFYLGLTLWLVGSWSFSVVLLRTHGWWRRAHPTAPLPLPVHGMVAAAILWLIATAGLAVEVVGYLLPWSLGWVERVDPMVARTWFWYFGHPLVYFWLLPTYVIWYSVAPRLAGGQLFSDRLARLVFILFILFSTPVGFHHQFSDPGIAAGWKLLHTLLTYAILFPSFVTAFTVTASFELGGRRQGAKGWFDWLGKLPWNEPLFASVALSMLAFMLGGFGGAINAAFAMNSLVHNTAWIPGHFHLTVGTATALTFMGTVYWLLPRLLGRALALPGLARWQPYLWFVGMMLFAIPSHIAGVLGLPRRLFATDFQGSPLAAPWQAWTQVAATGGALLLVSAAAFLAVVVATIIWGRKVSFRPIEFATPLIPTPATGLWDRFGLWTLVAVVLILFAYAYPFYHLYALPRFPSPAFKPF